MYRYKLTDYAIAVTTDRVVDYIYPDNKASYVCITGLHKAKN